MTLYPVLNILKKRGLIDFVREGRRRYWSIESAESIATNLSNLASVTHKGTVQVAKENSGFIVHRDIKAVYSVFEKVARLKPGERVYGIQPTFSMLNVMKNLQWQKDLTPIQDAIREKGIIIEAVLQEDYYTSMYQYLAKKDPKNALNSLKSFIGRATDMVYVDKKYLHASSELMMFRNVAYLVNWKDGVSIEIHDKDMLDFLFRLYEVARGYGQKVDQNQYLRGLVKKIEGC
jgi:hypothetical protein